MKIELPAAIVIAGALIATALYVTNETPEAVAAADAWTGVGVASTAGGVTAAFVLNTETGEVRRCYVGVGNNDCTSVPHR